MPKAKKQFRNYEEDLLEKLTNHEYAKVYLSVALEEHKNDNNIAAFNLALRHVAMAQGGLAKLAKRSKLNRQGLYKSLSNKGNPQLSTIGAILDSLGFRLSVEAVV